MKNLLGVLVGAAAGSVPGLLIGYLVWFPLRIWLFSQIPVEVQWAFWAKLVSCVLLFGTIGGSLPIWLTLVGVGVGIGLGNAVTK